MFYFPLLMLFVHSAWISVWGFKIWKSYFRTMGGTKRRNFKNQLICAWSIKNKVFKKKIYHNLPLLNQQQKACFQQARRQKGLIQQRGLKCPTPMPASILHTAVYNSNLHHKLTPHFDDNFESLLWLLFPLEKNMLLNEVIENLVKCLGN